MLVMLDIFIIVIIVIIVFMMYSGFMSLLDSKVMAMTQNSMGPALFLFGLCTPMFDGVKLMLKFGLLILNIEILYLFMMTMTSLLFNYSMLFMMPLTNMMLVNINFNHFILLALHSMLSTMNTFLVGCFIMNTCFVYLATISVILFSMMAEFCMMMMFLYMANMHFYALFNFIMLNIFNTLLCNFMCFPFFVLMLMMLSIYLHNLMNIFEFSEAESELVAGTITEFSGMFFCMSSLMEMAHMIMSIYLLLAMLFGGFYCNLKFMLILMFLFLAPKLLLCSLKINNALLFLIFYLFNYLFIYLLLINFMKLMIMSLN